MKPEDVRADWKVSRLLDEFPQAVSILEALSPHFGKLRNPLLRKALAPRATLEQAARIAGFEPAVLLDAIRKGLDSPSVPPLPTAEAAKPGPLREACFLESDDGILLDVRPILASGTDPLEAILEASRHVRDGRELHIINSFEPVPLFAVMKRRGWEVRSEKIGEEWHVRFHRSGDSRATSKPAETWDATKNSTLHLPRELDVRGLEPPEPMTRILAAIEDLPAGETLVVRHHREPFPLYARLEERGFSHDAEKISDDEYRISIRRAEKSLS